MIRIRKSLDRGHHKEGWLESRHSFSFHNYHDPAHMGFRNLRVINEDHIAPDTGFGMHPHEDMEIITFVLSGRLQHRDDMGNVESIGPYELQRLTAGRGIRHSETNPDKEKEVHLFQMWVLPQEQGLEPGYEIRRFPERKLDALTLLASPDGRDGSAVIRQDVRLYYGALESGCGLAIPLERGRHGWLQLIRGRLVLSGKPLETGDGAAISEEPQLRLQAEEASEFLLFDLH